MRVAKWVVNKLIVLEFLGSGMQIEGEQNRVDVGIFLTESFGRYYHIYFVFIPALIHKYESLQVF